MDIEEIEMNSCLETARIIAMRWDIEPWNFVLTIDATLSEMPDNKARRGWLMFQGMHETTLRFENTRIPLGFFAYNFSTRQEGKYILTEFWSQHPDFRSPISPDRQTLCRSGISAKKVTLLLSSSSHDLDSDGLIFRSAESNLEFDLALYEYISPAQKLLEGN